MELFGTNTDISAHPVVLSVLAVIVLADAFLIAFFVIWRYCFPVSWASYYATKERAFSLWELPREKAVWVLIRSNSPKAIKPLLIACRDNYKTYEIIKGVKNICLHAREKALPILLEMLDSEYLPTRRAVVEILSEIGDEQIIDSLIERLKDSSPAVAQAYINIAGIPEVKPENRQLLEKLRISGDIRVEENLIQIDFPFTTPLIEVLKEKGMPTETMLKGGIPAARDAVEKCLREKDRESALKMAINLGIRLIKRNIKPCSALQYGVPLAAQSAQDRLDWFEQNLEAVEKQAIKLDKGNINPYQTFVEALELTDLINNPDEFKEALETADLIIKLKKRLEKKKHEAAEKAQMWQEKGRPNERFISYEEIDFDKEIAQLIKTIEDIHTLKLVIKEELSIGGIIYFQVNKEDKNEWKRVEKSIATGYYEGGAYEDTGEYSDFMVWVDARMEKVKSDLTSRYGNIRILKFIDGFEEEEHCGIGPECFHYDYTHHVAPIVIFEVHVGKIEVLTYSVGLTMSHFRSGPESKWQEFVSSLTPENVKEKFAELRKEIKAETSDASISSTGGMSREAHEQDNQVVAQSPRFLAHRGKRGEVSIDYQGKVSKTQQQRIERAIKQTKGLSLELPEGLGKVDIYETLQRANILWVQAQPRSPPVEGHAGADRNAIYLITSSLDEVPSVKLIETLAEETIELTAKQRVISQGLVWTEELAQAVDDLAKRTIGKAFAGMAAYASGELSSFGADVWRLSGKSFEEILEYLRDEDPYSRAAAARKLGILKDPRAIQPLIEALADSRYPEGYALVAHDSFYWCDAEIEAKWALIAIGKPAIEPLRQALEKTKDVLLQSTINDIIKEIEKENASLDANISSSGDMSREAHEQANQVVAQSPKFLAHRGKIGRVSIDYQGKVSRRQQQRIERAIKQTKGLSVELPLNLGTVDVYKTLQRANILWVNAKPRAPPLEGHAGARRNAIYLITSSLDEVSDLKLTETLTEEAIELVAKQRARDWNENLAKEVHDKTRTFITQTAHPFWDLKDEIQLRTRILRYILKEEINLLPDLPDYPTLPKIKRPVFNVRNKLSSDVASVILGNQDLANVVLGLSPAALVTLNISDKELFDLAYALLILKHMRGIGIKILSLAKPGQFYIYDEDYLRSMAEEKEVGVAGTRQGLESLIREDVVAKRGKYYELVQERLPSTIQEVRKEFVDSIFNKGNSVHFLRPLEISMLCIPTYERPDALDRAITAQTTGLRLFGNENLPIVVIDSSVNVEKEKTKEVNLKGIDTYFPYQHLYCYEFIVDSTEEKITYWKFRPIWNRDGKLERWELIGQGELNSADIKWEEGAKLVIEGMEVNLDKRDSPSANQKLELYTINFVQEHLRVIETHRERGFNIQYISSQAIESWKEVVLQRLYDDYTSQLRAKTLDERIYAEISDGKGGIDKDKLREIVFASMDITNIAGKRTVIQAMTQGKKIASADDDALPMTRIPTIESLRTIFARRKAKVEVATDELYNQLSQIEGIQVTNDAEFEDLLARLDSLPGLIQQKVNNKLTEAYAYSEDGSTGYIPQAAEQIVRTLPEDVKDPQKDGYERRLRFDRILHQDLPEYLVVSEDIGSDTYKDLPDIDNLKAYDWVPVDYLKVFDETLGAKIGSPKTGRVFIRDLRGTAGSLDTARPDRKVLLATSHFSGDRDNSAKDLFTEAMDKFERDMHAGKPLNTRYLQQVVRKAIFVEVDGSVSNLLHNGNQFCFNTTSLDNTEFPIPTTGAWLRIEEPFQFSLIQFVMNGAMAWSRTVGGHERCPGSRRPKVEMQYLWEECAMVLYRELDKILRSLTKEIQAETDPAVRISRLGEEYLGRAKIYKIPAVEEEQLRNTCERVTEQVNRLYAWAEYAQNPEDKEELLDLYGKRDSKPSGFVKQFALAVYEFEVQEDGHTAKYTRWEPIWHHHWEPAKLVEEYEWKKTQTETVDLSEVDWDNNPTITLSDGTKLHPVSYKRIPRPKPTRGSTFKVAVADRERQKDLLIKAEEMIQKQFIWDGQQLLIWADILRGAKDFDEYHREWMKGHPLFSDSVPQKRTDSLKEIKCDLDRVAVLILAAGVGSRLWPASRKEYPKQLRCFNDTETSMIQRTVERVLKLVPAERIFISTTFKLAEQTKEQLPQLPAENIIVMPIVRETSIGIGNAAIRIKKALEKQGIPQSTMVVLPSDHEIEEPDKFFAYLKEAIAVAQLGEHIVTLGITPTYNATGYGHILTEAAKLAGTSNTYLGLGFKEKPPYPVRPRFRHEIQEKHKGTYSPGTIPADMVAEELTQKGAVWNAGMFICQIDTLLAAFKEHIPQIYKGLMDIYNALGRLEEEEVALDVFATKEFEYAKSIDFEIMEKLSPEGKQKLATVKAEDIGWNDVGAWDAVGGKKDADNNTIIQSIDNVILTNTRNCIIFAAEGEKIEVRGVENLIIISFPDVSLVMDKARAQDAKMVFAALEQQPEMSAYVDKKRVLKPLIHTNLFDTRDSPIESEYGLITTVGINKVSIYKEKGLLTVIGVRKSEEEAWWRYHGRYIKLETERAVGQTVTAVLEGLEEDKDLKALETEAERTFLKDLANLLVETHVRHHVKEHQEKIAQRLKEDKKAKPLIHVGHVLLRLKRQSLKAYYQYKDYQARSKDRDIISISYGTPFLDLEGLPEKEITGRPTDTNEIMVMGPTLSSLNAATQLIEELLDILGAEIEEQWDIKIEDVYFRSHEIIRKETTPLPKDTLPGTKRLTETELGALIRVLDNIKEISGLYIHLAKAESFLNEDSDANISSTGDMSREAHKQGNQLVAQSPRFLAHRGKQGRVTIDYQGKVSKTQQQRIERAIKQTKGLSLELPKTLGKVDIYETLQKANILWVQAKPRSPPLEGHAGADRNAIYLITTSLEEVSDLELLQTLIEEVIELEAKKRTRAKRWWWTRKWTKRKARRIHKFVHKNISWLLGELVVKGRLDFDKTVQELWDQRMERGGVFGYELGEVPSKQEGKFKLIRFSQGRIDYIKRHHAPQATQRTQEPVDTSIFKPFDRKRPNFNKFLKQEGPARRLLDLVIDGKHIAIDINRYPALRHVFCIVPEPEKEQPQYLTQEAVESARAVMRLSKSPYLRILYEGWNVGASINHLHLQGYYCEDDGMPIEKASTKEITKIQDVKIERLPDWPINSVRFDKPDTDTSLRLAFSYIDTLQSENTAPLLMLSKHCLYIMPRRPSHPLSFSAGSGIGAPNAIGLFFTENDEVFHRLTEADISKEIPDVINFGNEEFQATLDRWFAEATSTERDAPEGPDANISSAGDMSPEAHEQANQVVAQSPRFLAHQGIQGELPIDYEGEVSPEQQQKIEKAIENTKGLSIELPRALGNVDIFETLQKTNILWANAKPRAPPIEGHAGARRNAIYLITTSLEEVPVLKLTPTLSQEVVELAAKQKAHQQGIEWTEELAREIHNRYIKITKNPSRSKSGLSLKLERVSQEINRTRTRVILPFRINEGLKVTELYIKNSKPELMQVLSELKDILRKGNLRTGTFRLIYGAINGGILYIDERVLEDRIEVARTIIHLIGSLAGLGHKGNIQLERDFLIYTHTNEFVEEGVSADELNARRMEAHLDKLSPAKFFWLEDEYIDATSAIDALLRGELTVFLFAAGEATRLRESLIRYGVIPPEEINDPESQKKYKMWNLDIVGVAEALNKKRPELERRLGEVILALHRTQKGTKLYEELQEEAQELEAIMTGLETLEKEGARHEKLGARHILALTEGIRIEAQKRGFDVGRVLENLKLAISVNSEIKSDVEQTLIERDFFGLTLENVVLVLNDFAPGYKLQNGELVLTDKITDYNHGFNIINANFGYMGYVYDEATGRFEEEPRPVFRYLVDKGANTAVVHRINDLILLIPECAIDIDMYAFYRRKRTETGANILVEVLNNFTGQKGGLAISRTDIKDPFIFLVEGLAAKSESVQAALSIINNWLRAQQELPGIPYNRLYKYFDIDEIAESLRENGGLLPMSIKDDDLKEGIISPEIPSGDITILPKAATIAVIRRNDTLIDRKILPPDKHYTPRNGCLIHDFKALKNIADAVRVITVQDQDTASGSEGSSVNSLIKRRVRPGQRPELKYTVVYNRATLRHNLTSRNRKVFERTWHNLFSQYPELKDRRITINFYSGNENLAQVEEDRTIVLDIDTLRSSFLIELELKGELDNLARRLWTGRTHPTPSEKAIEEIYGTVDKAKYFFNYCNNIQRTSVLISLIQTKDLDDKELFKILIRCIPDFEKGKVIASLKKHFSKGTKRRHLPTIKKMEKLNPFANYSEVVKGVRSYALTNGVLPTNMQSYLRALTPEQLEIELNALETGPMHYIRKMNNALKVKKSWDAIVVTTVDKPMAKYLKKRLKELRGKLYPKTTRLVVLPRDRPMRNLDGTVAALDYVLGSKLKPSDKVLVLHTAGRGARNYPITAVAKKNKANIEVPLAIGNRVLSSLDQAIRQYHMLLEDTPRGTITIGTIDQQWAISKGIGGKIKDLQVFGNRRDLNPVINDLQKLGLIKGKDEHSHIISDYNDSEINEKLTKLLKDPRLDEKAPALKSLSELGQIWPDQESNILDMTEKPKDWPTLKRLLEEGVSNINWWNHRYTFKGARWMVDIYKKYIGMELDFSHNFLEAITKRKEVYIEESIEKLIVKLVDKKVKDLRQQGLLTEPLTYEDFERIKNEVLAEEASEIDREREKLSLAWDLAQEALEKFKVVSYINAGMTSRFEDTGINTKLLQAYMRTLPDPKDIVPKEGYGYDLIQAALLSIKDNIIASPKIEKAIKAGKIKIAPEVKVLFIGSDIKEGHIKARVVNGKPQPTYVLIVNTHVDILTTRGDAIIWGIRGPPSGTLDVEHDYLVADVVIDNELQRVIRPIGEDPSKEGGLADQIEARVPDDPKEIEKIYKEKTTVGLFEILPKKIMSAREKLKIVRKRLKNIDEVNQEIIEMIKGRRPDITEEDIRKVENLEMSIKFLHFLEELTPEAHTGADTVSVDRLYEESVTSLSLLIEYLVDREAEIPQKVYVWTSNPKDVDFGTHPEADCTEIMILGEDIPKLQAKISGSITAHDGTIIRSRGETNKSIVDERIFFNVLEVEKADKAGKPIGRFADEGKAIAETIEKIGYKEPSTREETIKRITRNIKAIRPDIEDSFIEELQRAHTHPTLKYVPWREREPRLNEHGILAWDLIETFKGLKKPKRLVFINNSYEGIIEDPVGYIDVTELLIIVPDDETIINKEVEKINKLNGELTDPVWKYHIGRVGDMETEYALIGIEVKNKESKRRFNISDIALQYLGDKDTIVYTSIGDSTGIKLLRLYPERKSDSEKVTFGNIPEALHPVLNDLIASLFENKKDVSRRFKEYKSRSAIRKKVFKFLDRLKYEALANTQREKFKDKKEFEKKKRDLKKNLSIKYLNTGRNLFWVEGKYGASHYGKKRGNVYVSAGYATEAFPAQIYEVVIHDVLHILGFTHLQALHIAHDHKISYGAEERMNELAEEDYVTIQGLIPSTPIERKRKKLRDYILKSQVIFNKLSIDEANAYIEQLQTFLSDRELIITDGISDYEIKELLDNQEAVYSENEGIRWVCFADKTQKDVDAYFYLVLKNEKAVGHGRFMSTIGYLGKMVDFMYYISPEERKNIGLVSLRLVLSNIYHKVNKQVKVFRIPAAIRYMQMGRESRYKDIIESGTLIFFVLNGFQPIPIIRKDKRRIDEVMKFIRSSVARRSLPKEVAHHYSEELSKQHLFLTLGKSTDDAEESKLEQVRSRTSQKGKKSSTKPGKSPEDAKKVIALSDHIQKILENQGWFTLQDYRIGYEEVAGKLGFEPLARNWEQTARGDLEKLSPHFLKIDEKRKPYKYQVTSVGKEGVAKIQKDYEARKPSETLIERYRLLVNKISDKSKDAEGVYNRAYLIVLTVLAAYLAEQRGELTEELVKQFREGLLEDLENAQRDEPEKIDKALETLHKINMHTDNRKKSVANGLCKMVTLAARKADKEDYADVKLTTSGPSKKSLLSKYYKLAKEVLEGEPIKKQFSKMTRELAVSVLEGYYYDKFHIFSPWIRKIHTTEWVAKLLIALKNAGKQDIVEAKKILTDEIYIKIETKEKDSIVDRLWEMLDLAYQGEDPAQALLLSKDFEKWEHVNRRDRRKVAIDIIAEEFSTDKEMLAYLIEEMERPSFRGKVEDANKPRFYLQLRRLKYILDRIGARNRLPNKFPKKNKIGGLSTLNEALERIRLFDQEETTQPPGESPEDSKRSKWREKMEEYRKRGLGKRGLPLVLLGPGILLSKDSIMGPISDLRASIGARKQMIIFGLFILASLILAINSNVIASWVKNWWANIGKVDSEKTPSEKTDTKTPKKSKKGPSRRFMSILLGGLGISLIMNSNVFGAVGEIIKNGPQAGLGIGLGLGGILVFAVAVVGARAIYREVSLTGTGIVEVGQVRLPQVLGLEGRPWKVAPTRVWQALARLFEGGRGFVAAIFRQPSKRAELRMSWLGPREELSQEKITEIMELARRLLVKEGSSRENPEIRRLLTWTSLPEQMQGEVGRIEKFARTVRRHYERVVVIGEEARLYAEVAATIAGERKGSPELYVLESTHPKAVREKIEREINPEETLFVVSSAEPVEYLYEKLTKFYKAQGIPAGEIASQVGKHFVAIAETKTPLAKKAREREFLRTFNVPEGISGSSAIFSEGALFILTLAGVDIKGFVESGREGMEMSRRENPKENPAIQLAAFQEVMREAGRQIVLVLSEELAGFGEVWQGVISPLGKEGKEIIVIGEEELVAGGRFGEKTAFIRLKVGREKESLAIEQLREAGYPVLEITLPGEEAIGALFYVAGFATTLSYLMGISPTRKDIESSPAKAVGYQSEGIPSGVAASFSLRKNEPFSEYQIGRRGLGSKVTKVVAIDLRSVLEMEIDEEATPSKMRRKLRVRPKSIGVFGVMKNIIDVAKEEGSLHRVKFAFVSSEKGVTKEVIEQMLRDYMSANGLSPEVVANIINKKLIIDQETLSKAGGIVGISRTPKISAEAVFSLITERLLGRIGGNGIKVNIITDSEDRWEKKGRREIMERILWVLLKPAEEGEILSTAAGLVVAIEGKVSKWLIEFIEKNYPGRANELLPQIRKDGMIILPAAPVDEKYLEKIRSQEKAYQIQA